MSRAVARPRRSHVERGIYERIRADGRRSLEIGYTNRAGDWTMETVGVVSTEEARDVRLQRLAEARRPGRASNRAKWTVNDVAQRYLASRLPTLKPSSRDQYRRVVRYLGHFPLGDPLGTRRIDKVESTHCEDWIEAIREDHVESTALTYTSIAKEPFNWAVNHGFIDFNPFLRIDRWLMPKRGATRHRIPTPDELARLLGVADPDDRDMIELGFGAGPRRAELGGLRWGDWTRDGILNIEHQINSDGALVSLKSTASERQIPLAPVIDEMLERRCERLGRPPADHFIFGDGTKAPRLADLSARFARAVDRAAIAQPLENRLVLHCLRHLYATLLFTQPELSDDYIARLLGHASALETKRTYRHLWKRFRRPPQLVDEMDTLLRDLCQGVSDLGFDLSQSTTNG